MSRGVMAGQRAVGATSSRSRSAPRCATWARSRTSPSASDSDCQAPAGPNPRGCSSPLLRHGEACRSIQSPVVHQTQHRFAAAVEPNRAASTRRSQRRWSRRWMISASRSWRSACLRSSAGAMRNDCSTRRRLPAASASTPRRSSALLGPAESSVPAGSATSGASASASSMCCRVSDESPHPGRDDRHLGLPARAMWRMRFEAPADAVERRRVAIQSARTGSNLGGTACP
jgi:hypothetical protein